MRAHITIGLISVSVGIHACGNTPATEALAQTASLATRSAANPLIVSPSESTELVLRRLWTGEDLDYYGPSVSPDGQFVSYIAWGPRQLAVRNPITGERHLLTNAPNDGSGPLQTPGASAFSRDGRHISYAWWFGNDLQLRVMDFEVGKDGVPRARNPRVIYSNPQMEPYDPWDWSPDGKQVLVQMYGDNNTSAFVLVASDGSSSQTLKTFDWRTPSRAKYSPDGRYIAYDFQPDPESDDRDIYVVSTDGTYEAPVVTGSSQDWFLEWHPDGSILYLSDRGGTPGVWRAPTNRGRASSAPTLLRADAWGHVPLGLAGETYYFAVRAERPRLHTAAVNLASGRLISSPIPIEDPYGEEINYWEWSPDGQHLAYLTDPDPGDPRLVIHSVEGEEVQRLPLDLRNVRALQWTADGETVVVSGSDRGGQSGFHGVDLETGTLRTLLRDNELDEPRDGSAFDLAPDGGTIYVRTRAGEGGPVHLTARTLSSGTERQLATVGWQARMSLSADGSKLATTLPRDGSTEGPELAVVPTQGGPFHGVYRLPRAAQWFRSVDWTPDGRTILFLIGEGDPRSPQCCALWTVSSTGRTPQRIEGIDALANRPVRMSPDGRQIAYRAGRIRNEIWVMENIADVAAGSGAR